MMEIHRSLMYLAFFICYCKITVQYSPNEWITDLDVVAGDKDIQCKEGFTKLPQNFNEGVQDSAHVYACIKKGEIQKTPLNSIVVIVSTYLKGKVFCPENKYREKEYHRIDTDLNYAIDKAPATYFCFTRGRDTKITAINFYAQDTESVPTIDAAKGSCSSQNLNRRTGGKFIYMCYSYDETDILEIRLEDVVYDWARKVDGFSRLATVQDVSISNPSDTDTSQATSAGTFTYSSSSKWHLNDSDVNELGHSLKVVAGIPEFDPVIGWTTSETLTVETKVGRKTSTSADTSYSVSCGAIPKTITRCRGFYKQGRISVPYNATKITRYTDGTSKAMKITGHMYEGTAQAVLEISKKVAKKL